MRTSVLNFIRKIGIPIFVLFALLFAIDTYAQWGTNRRVARRTARRTTRRNVGYGGAGTVYAEPPGGNYHPYYQGTNVVYAPY